MAWTSPATVTTGQLMTAAFWNQQVRDNMSFLSGTSGVNNTGNRTYTNTSFLDLDALTGGAGSLTAAIVSVTTGATASVTVAGRMNNTAGTARLGYRVSGASTIAASTIRCVTTASTSSAAYSWNGWEDGLTPGVNIFELQASVTAGTGLLAEPQLIVAPGV